MATYWGEARAMRKPKNYKPPKGNTGDSRDDLKNPLRAGAL